MRPTLTLTAHSIARSRRVLVAFGLLLAGFQVLMVLAAGTLQTTGMFSQFAAIVPPFAQVLAGPAIVSVLSFAGVVSVGYFHVVITGAIIALAVVLSTEIAGESETGLVDLLYARPIGRLVGVGRGVLVLLSGTAWTIGCMVAGTFLGLWWLAPKRELWPSPGLVLALAVNLWALVLCWGGVGLAVASASRRRAVAMSLTVIAALAMFLLDYLARIRHPAESVAWLSPFRYYSGVDLVMGHRLPVGHLVVLLGVAAVGMVAAGFIYRARDL